MAFQPFQMPAESGFSRGVEGLSQSLQELARARQERDRMAADNLLRGRQLSIEEQRAALAKNADQRQANREMGDEHIKIRDLYARDPRLAASYLNSIGAKGVALDPVYGDGQAPQAPSLGAATPSASPGAPPAFEGDQGEEEPAKLPVEPPPLAQQGAPATTAPLAPAAPAPTAPQQPTGPLIGHKLRYSLGDGPETTLDPLEMKQIRDGEEQAKIGKLDAAGLPPKYKMIIAARISQGSKDPWAGIEESMRADEERKFKAEEAAKYQLTAPQKYRVGMMGAQARQLSSQAGAGAKDDAASARAQGLAERAAVDVDRLVNWKDLQTMDNKTRLALGELSTNHALPERDAKVLAASIFRGGVPTGGEMHELYSNLGGTADAWERFKSNVLSGRLDDLQREQLKSSLTTAADVVSDRKNRALKTLQARFGQGSGYEVMGPQINSIIRAHAVQAGVDDFPNLYDEQATGPGAVLLGSRKKHVPAGAKAPNPLVQAAQTSGMPGDMSAWVRDNPGPKADAIVAKWKKDNGVRP